MDLEHLKKQAALYALEHVQSGMVVGLGSGSTATYFIQALGEKLQRGELSDIIGVPSSKRSQELALKLSIPLQELTPEGVDVAIDGMDEVDPKLNAIKGLGGAQTREKIVASSAKVFILISDESKMVKHLGEKAPIPVEVIPFGYKATWAKLEKLVSKVEQRMNSQEPFFTDNGNYILHCHITPPVDVKTLAQTLSGTPGVVEHGLFLDMAEVAYVATAHNVLKLKAV